MKLTIALSLLAGLVVAATAQAQLAGILVPSQNSRPLTNSSQTVFASGPRRIFHLAGPVTNALFLAPSPRWHPLPPQPLAIPHDTTPNGGPYVVVRSASLNGERLLSSDVELDVRDSIARSSAPEPTNGWAALNTLKESQTLAPHFAVSTLNSSRSWFQQNASSWEQEAKDKGAWTFDFLTNAPLTYSRSKPDHDWAPGPFQFPGQRQTGFKVGNGRLEFQIGVRNSEPPFESSHEAFFGIGWHSK